MIKLPTIFVVPGQGVKVPLPVPGMAPVNGVGGFVERTMAVERLLRTGDLVLGEAPKIEQPAAAAPAPAAKADAPAAAANDAEKKKG